MLAQSADCTFARTRVSWPIHATSDSGTMSQGPCAILFRLIESDGDGQSGPYDGYRNREAIPGTRESGQGRDATETSDKNKIDRPARRAIVFGGVLLGDRLTSL
jgi:hypothetical protein